MVFEGLEPEVVAGVNDEVAFEPEADAFLPELSIFKLLPSITGADDEDVGEA